MHNELHLVTDSTQRVRASEVTPSAVGQSRGVWSQGSVVTILATCTIYRYGTGTKAETSRLHVSASSEYEQNSNRTAQ